MSQRSRVRRSLVPLFLLGVGFGGTASAQSPLPLFLQADPEARLVSVALAFSGGNASDPPGQEGAAFLLGRVLEGEANARVAPFNGQVQVEVDRNRTVIMLLAPPQGWANAYREITRLLGSDPLPEGQVAEERNRLLQRLLFDQDAPVRFFERERATLLFGAGDPSARSLRGSRESVDRIDYGTLNRLRSELLGLSLARVAVTGPLSVGEVQREVGRATTLVRSPFSAPFRPPPSGVVAPPVDSIRLPEGVIEGERRQVETPLPPAPSIRLGALNLPAWRVPSGPGAALAWDEGERTLRDQQLTSTWIAALYPIPRGTPRVLQEFLAHLVTEALNPIPPEPGQYASEARVEEVRGAPVLQITATVDPRIALRWEERIVATLELLGENPPEGAFFELARRRFRTARLMGVATPEGLARWIALNAADDGAIPDLAGEVWGLDQQGIRGLAQSLGPPRFLLYGPESMLGR